MKAHLAYMHNPLAFARDVLGFQPEPFQERILDASVHRLIIAASRGAGKTEAVAVRATWHLAVRPDSLVLVISETAEKAAELVQRVARHLAAAGLDLTPDPLRKHGFRTSNGSRILPVPSRPGAVRGYPATMVLVDEAAVVPDSMWAALSGTRAATYQKSSIILLSTPGARRGFFYEIFTSADPSWLRIKAPATEVRHIHPGFLAEQRRDLSPDDFQREYMADFAEPRTALFREDRYNQAVDPAIPVFDAITKFVPTERPYLGAHALLSNGQRVPSNGFYLGVDLGQSRDFSTFAVVEYRLIPTGKADPITLAPFYHSEFRLRWLQRFPIETPYPEIADVLIDFVVYSELSKRAILVIDATGVGRGFLDALRRSKLPAQIRGVQITAGAKITEDGGLTNIPKRDLILALDMLLNRGALRIAAACPELAAFRKELLAFERIRSTSGRWVYTGKTNGTDDLVMAVALAVGYACHLHPPPGLWEGLDRD